MRWYNLLGEDDVRFAMFEKGAMSAEVFDVAPMDSISIAFPMFNEKENLPRTVEKAARILSSITDDYEIIIVDDASTDGAGELAEQIGRVNNRIRVVHHPENKSLGGALKTGFGHATKEIIVYTDMDLPFDLERLREALPLLSEYDVVKGAATARGNPG